jgi:hypothetical protein
MKTDETGYQLCRKQYEHSQIVISHFWKRWLKEYVPSLTERKKWHGQQRNLTIGDLVLVVDENSPKGHWPIGRIVEVCPSATDGNVRVAKVEVPSSKSTYLRPITKLCLLFTNEELNSPKSIVSESQ